MTLESAITGLVDMGEKDPLTIVAKLEKTYGAEWLAAEVATHASDFVAALARQIIGAQRRSWSLGHQDAAALRYVGKCFLRDLWVAAREGG